MKLILQHSRNLVKFTYRESLTKRQHPAVQTAAAAAATAAAAEVAVCSSESWMPWHDACPLAPAPIGSTSGCTNVSRHAPLRCQFGQARRRSSSAAAVCLPYDGTSASARSSTGAVRRGSIVRSAHGGLIDNRCFCQICNRTASHRRCNKIESGNVKFCPTLTAEFPGRPRKIPLSNFRGTVRVRPSVCHIRDPRYA